jgi:hypothetical protein
METKENSLTEQLKLDKESRVKACGEELAEIMKKHNCTIQVMAVFVGMGTQVTPDLRIQIVANNPE